MKNQTKTTGKIYDQQQRIYKLLWEVTSMKIKQCDPDTGGNLHLAHNWGNDQAQQYLQQHSERGIFLFNLFDKYFKLAFAHENPEHLRSKEYIQKYAA